MTQDDSQIASDKSNVGRCSGFLHRHNQIFLFLALSALVIGWPFAQKIELVEPYFELIIIAIFFAGLPTLYRNRLLVLTLGILAAVALSADWISNDEQPALELVASLTSIIFLVLITIHVVSVVYSDSTKVNWSTILGAINAYLLLGIVFAFVYDVIDQLAPNSFADTGVFAGDVDLKVVSFLYFSFVTLTTLGYGDIVPQTPEVAVIAYSEVIIGQFYLVVMVARLVSLHVSRP